MNGGREQCSGVHTLKPYDPSMYRRRESEEEIELSGREKEGCWADGVL